MAFKYHPNHVSSLGLHNLLDSQAEVDGKWQPARPISCPTLFQRIRYAWWVLVGKADVLTWPKQ